MTETRSVSSIDGTELGADTSEATERSGAPETSSAPPELDAVDGAQTAADALFAASPALPGPPEISPDGTTLAYLLADETGALRLWLSPLDGGPPWELPVPFTLVAEHDPDTGRALRGPQWSPDGATLAVTGLTEGSNRTAIWLVPVAAAEDGPRHHDEEDRVPILLCDHPAADRSPRWSPDGTEIAFVSRRDGRDAIALAPALGDAPAQPLTFGMRDDREPVWSRDGRFLAFRRLRADGPEHADIFVYLPETGEVRDLTGQKDSAVRHSPEWVPGRNLVAYVTLDGEWQSIAVVNADNKAGWTVTREAGDKTEPRFAPEEARLVYIRTEGFTTVCCERGLHASNATVIDPGEGVVRYPRMLRGKRVVYGFSAPARPFGVVVQSNTVDAECTFLMPPAALSLGGFRARLPVPFEFAVGPEEQFSGMLYRTAEQAGPTPGIVYLPDGPLMTRRGEFQLEEQALASGGMTVLTPVLHGAAGFGVSIEEDLSALAGEEIEVGDIAAAGHALGEREDILVDRLVLVGHGFGGTLALLAAGGRPGIFAAVVAIDPILDWAIELDHAETPWRTWVMRQYGTPLTHPDHYALRTPATFAAVIDAPLLLVTTADAPAHRHAQLPAFTAYLDSARVTYERLDTGPRPIALTLREVELALRHRFRPERRRDRGPAVEEPSNEAPVPAEPPTSDEPTPVTR